MKVLTLGDLRKLNLPDETRITLEGGIIENYATQAIPTTYKARTEVHTILPESRIQADSPGFLMIESEPETVLLIVGSERVQTQDRSGSDAPRSPGR